MQAKALLAVIALGLTSCASTSWQDVTRKSLRGVSAGSEAAIVTANQACESTLNVCIAKKENPCVALQKCLQVRQHIIEAAVMAQLAALSGYAAVDIADKPSAQKALSEALRLMGSIQQALEALD